MGEASVEFTPTGGVERTVSKPTKRSNWVFSPLVTHYGWKHNAKVKAQMKEWLGETPAAGGVSLPAILSGNALRGYSMAVDSLRHNQLVIAREKTPLVLSLIIYNYDLIYYVSVKSLEPRTRASVLDEPEEERV